MVTIDTSEYTLRGGGGDDAGHETQFFFFFISGFRDAVYLVKMFFPMRKESSKKFLSLWIFQFMPN